MENGGQVKDNHAAFVAAGNRSYFGIETDVHKTIDGHYVVIHDDTTARVAGEDLNVEQSTFAEIRALLLKQKDGNKGRTDIRIPTLEEYIAICKQYDKTAVLEFKNLFEKADIEEMIARIRALGCDSRAGMISGTDPPVNAPPSAPPVHSERPRLRVNRRGWMDNPRGGGTEGDRGAASCPSP